MQLSSPMEMIIVMVDMLDEPRGVVWPGFKKCSKNRAGNEWAEDKPD
jgi:hypothetical protein